MLSSWRCLEENGSTGNTVLLARAVRGFSFRCVQFENALQLGSRHSRIIVRDRSLNSQLPSIVIPPEAVYCTFHLLPPGSPCRVSSPLAVPPGQSLAAGVHRAIYSERPAAIVALFTPNLSWRLRMRMISRWGFAAPTRQQEMHALGALWTGSEKRMVLERRGKEILLL